MITAASGLCDDEQLLPWECERVGEILRWFGGYLNNPTSFNRSSRPNRTEKAISWFKDSATSHITMMRELVAILQSHGVIVDTVTTDRPGYVTYEDDFQIVAEPFADTQA